MKKVTEYTPTEIEFVINHEIEESIPEMLGEFKTPKQVQKFFNENNFITLNPLVTAVRKMDAIEINDLRGMYIEELEETLPELEANARIAQSNFDNAKDYLKTQNERVSASHTKVDMLVSEIKAGIKEMDLDQSKTFEIAHKNKYLYYTLINGELTLCKVSDIPKYEISGIFNSSEANFDALKKLIKKAN
ncbi:MAG: hypothetical protein QQN55_01175 [Nitrosopumilus sp.]